MKRLPHSRFALPIAGALLLATLVTGSYFLGRAISGGESTSAQTPRGTPTPVPPGEELPAMPDTSQPGWAHPYTLAEAAKPRFNQQLGEILVGPDIDMGDLCPGPTKPDDIPMDTITGSSVELSPIYLPARARIEHTEAAACDGKPSLATVEYFIPAVEEDLRRVRDGEITFFEARHSGIVILHRRIRPEASFQSFKPSERMRADTVAGRPAVLVEPMFAEGYGRAEVIIWDAESSTMTVVQTTDFTLGEAVKIAEGLFTK